MPAPVNASTIAHSQSLADQFNGLSLDSSLNDSLSQSLSDSSNLNDLSNEVVIVGAGMAGSRLAIQLATTWQQQTTAESPKITLISKEYEVGYNRIMLSPVLAGETSFEETYLYDKSDYER